MASFGGVAREFDPNQESFGTYSRWLEQYLVANGVSSDVKKRATLLSVVGPRTFALLEDLVAPRMVSDLPYAELVTVLQGHFEPKSSEIVARFRFHSCCREDHESVNDYTARLRRLAKPCQFAEGTLPEMLRDRLVCGIRDSRLQARLLSQPSLSLESALALACTSEAAEAQAREIGRAESAAAATGRAESAAAATGRQLAVVGRLEPRGAAAPLAGGARGQSAGGRGQRRTAGDAFGRRGGAPGRDRRQGQQQGTPCHRCRSRRHSPSSCWARNRRCFQCGEMGHVREACRAAGGNRVDRVDDEFDIPALQVVTAEAEEHDEAAEEVYTLFYQTSPSDKCRPPLFVDITLNGRAVRAEVDTGAAVSVCSEEQFRRLFPTGAPVISPSRRKLCTYGGRRRCAVR